MGSIDTPRQLRVAVLECDVPPGQAREKYGGYGNMFKELLEKGAETLAIDRGFPNEAVELDVSTFDVVNHEIYPTLDQIDAVLLTGSKYDSFENFPWILRLVEFTKEVLAHDRVKVIGVCFGHQIIGRAMGAEVGRNPKGWETAVEPQHLTERGKKIFGVEELCLHQMHRDIVFDYPPQVEQLGYTPRTQVPALYLPNKMISVQGHPEFNGDIVADIAKSRYDMGLFDQALYDDSMSRVRHPHHGDQIGFVFVRFLLEG